MLGRPRQSPNVAVVVLFVVVVIVLLFGLAAPTQVSQGPLSVIFVPVQRWVSTVGNAIGNFFRGTAETEELRQQVRALTDELNQVKIDNVRLREFQASNKQLRDLLRFTQENPTINVVGSDVIGIGNKGCVDQPRTGPTAGICAQAIGQDPSPYVRYLIINAGSSNGVKVGDPVVSGPFALIGRIGETSLTSSQVELLIDPNSSVNVRLIGTRATGTVDGMTDGSLRLRNVPQTDQLVAGDFIVTSGLGGTMPTPLTIGQVDQITSKEADVLQEAIVRPAVDFNRIEQVLVITNWQITGTLSNSTIVTPTFVLPPTAPVPTIEPTATATE